MAIPLKRQLDAENRKPIINAAPATANGEVVVFEQLNGALEGLGWKDNVRAATLSNITLSAPGGTIDGVTLVSGDRVLIKNQTSVPENGIYIFNGAGSPMTRSTDASTFDELESAVVTVDEGTNAGTTWRQTQVNGVIGTNNIVFTSFGTTPAQATETSTGVAEIATQAETDAGADDLRFVTPLKLFTWSLRMKQFATNIGDGSATSINVLHNLNTQNIQVEFTEAAGLKRNIITEYQIVSGTTITVLFDAPPALNSVHVVVQGL
ncbi:MAG: hypothetical protein ACKO0Z_28085 [Betaproteobacteria bacterium]